MDDKIAHNVSSVGSQTWDFDRLQSLITDQIEESLILDYKAAGALKSEPKCRAEITKDVSAMANAAGGTIVYGIREYSDKSKAHLPESIDPIQRGQISKEWVEHVVQNIRPRIDGIVIHPVVVPASPDSVIYVVEVPQSTTAHQAADFRYYRRFNFESVPMHDYEIRDVMARRQHPLIEIEFHLEYVTQYISESGLAGLQGKRRAYDCVFLCAVFVNRGRRVANYVTASLFLPQGIIEQSREALGEAKNINGTTFNSYQRKNLVRDVTGHIPGIMGDSYPKYGEHRFEPILPELTLNIASWHLSFREFKKQQSEGAKLIWVSYADDAPKRTGEILLSNLQTVDKRDKKEE